MTNTIDKKPLLDFVLAQLQINKEGIHGTSHWARVRHHGMFSDKETFYQYLKRLGYIFHRYISRINDQEILRSWKQQ
jgi:hypothetical protein